MKRLNAGLLLIGLFVIAACASVPNSGLNGGGAATQGNFKYDSPEFFVASVGDRVLFAVNQNTLGPEGLSVLDAQAAWLQENPGYSAVIEGHADEQGTREYNLALGARRAASVKDYLVSKGVGEGRLRTVSYGKERPIEVCSSEVCWSKNRRAVTLVSIGGTS